VAITNEQMIDIIGEHLPYEVQMLNFTFAGLCTGPNVLGPLPNNAFVEAFCVHARNLIDFFAEGSTSPKGPAGAKHYVGAFWRAFDGQNVKSEPFYDRLNNQIAHITYRREKDRTKKIGGDDITRIKQLLDAEMKRFVDVLPSKWRQVWNASAVKMGLYH
jgi:hypothetical protein